MLAARLGVPHYELDSVFHQPGWTELPVPEFRDRVRSLVAGDGWVVDGNYSAVQDLVWGRADTVVWLDLPRGVVTRRIVWRTVRRAARREVLWNGNRERWTNLMSTDPEKSVIAWSWRKHGEYREKYGAAAFDPAYSHLRFVRLQGEADIAELLAPS
jgi:adenylate kinase family enzyme